MRRLPLLAVSIGALSALLLIGCPENGGGDTTAPTLSSSDPANGLTDVAVNANIVLTFSENVTAGSGNITITPAGGSTITIPVDDGQVTIRDSVVTVNPAADFTGATEHTVVIPANGFRDAAGNGSAAITFAFTTAPDRTPPTVARSAPANTATDIAVNSNIVLTFSENVTAGSGNITLVPDRNMLGTTITTPTTITIPVGDAQVTINGAAVTIDPSSSLAGGPTRYTVNVPAGAFQDTAGNGLAANYMLAFTTQDDEDSDTILDAADLCPRQAATSGNDPDSDGCDSSIDVDDDGDGLIEINNLNELNNVRHNLVGTSYDDEADDSTGNEGDTSGCALRDHDNNDATDEIAACAGYELTRSLDFNDDNSYANPATPAEKSTWCPAANCAGTAEGGWVPIGTISSSNRFATTFEGNGHTISNLYVRGSTSADYIGLFGYTSTNAALRNIGMLDVKLYGGEGNDFIGGLVGRNNDGSITASYATGNTDGDDNFDVVGGLVGTNSGTISASYASGTVNGDANNDEIGGLVGRNEGSISASYAAGTVNGGDNTDNVGGLAGFNNGTISASYATGNTDGNDGFDSVGGLVGNNNSGNIIASYATGRVDGSAGGSSSTPDNVGGLVGLHQNSGATIIASYATGNADGGVGIDRAGALTGFSNQTITQSYGFGTATGETITAPAAAQHPNSAVTTAMALMSAGSSAPTGSSTNAGPRWTDTDTTDGVAWAWVFGGRDGSATVGNPNPVLKVDFNGDITTAEGATVSEFGSQANAYPTEDTSIAEIPCGCAGAGSDNMYTRDISSVFTDADSGDTLAITASSNSGNIVVSVNGSTLTITVKSGTANSTYMITLTANDGKGGIASSTFSIQVLT